MHDPPEVEPEPELLPDPELEPEPEPDDPELEADPELEPLPDPELEADDPELEPLPDPELEADPELEPLPDPELEAELPELDGPLELEPLDDDPPELEAPPASPSDPLFVSDEDEQEASTAMIAGRTKRTVALIANLQVRGDAAASCATRRRRRCDRVNGSPEAKPSSKGGFFQPSGRVFWRRPEPRRKTSAVRSWTLRDVPRVPACRVLTAQDSPTPALAKGVLRNLARWRQYVTGYHDHGWELAIAQPIIRLRNPKVESL